MLNPDTLEVVSFFPAEETSFAVQAAAIGGNSDGPDCIVYISDCVSCFPDPAGGVQ